MIFFSERDHAFTEIPIQVGSQISKYPNGRKEFSHWVEPKSDRIQDFREYIENESLLGNLAYGGTLPYRTLMPGEEEISEPVYY